MFIERDLGGNMYIDLSYAESMKADKDVRGGRIVIEGTRMTVAQLLTEISEGMTVSEFADDYDYDEEKIVKVIEELATEFESYKLYDADAYKIKKIENWRKKARSLFKEDVSDEDIDNLYYEACIDGIVDELSLSTSLRSMNEYENLQEQFGFSIYSEVSITKGPNKGFQGQIENINISQFPGTKTRLFIFLEIKNNSGSYYATPDMVEQVNSSQIGETD